MAGIDNDVNFGQGYRLEDTPSSKYPLMQQDATDVGQYNNAGSPEGVVSANPGSLCHDRTNGVIYYKNTGTGNTGWVLIPSGGAVGLTITGNFGGPLTPTAGNWNILGSGSLDLTGSGSTLTASLTGLTNHAVLVGAGTATITKVGPVASTGSVLMSNGLSSDPGFSTATYPLTTTINQLLYSSAANVVSGLATANNGILVTSNTGVPSILGGPGTTGNILQSNAASPPSYSTATYPSVATGTGTILRANGTNWVPSTATFPDTAGASGNVLTSDGTNWTSAANAATAGTLPIGSIVYYANNDATDLGSNWLKCDGTAYSQASYATLYARLGLINDRWTTTTLAITGGHASTLKSATYGNGLYVYGQQNGYIGTSTDAVTWTEQARPTSTDVLALTYGNGIYVGAGLGGTLATSTDGTTWTLRTSGTSSDIQALTFGNGIYVYGTAINGSIRTSTNGITWTARTSNATGAIKGLAYGNGLYVYVGLSNTIGVSTDGITWTEQGYANLADLQSVDFGNGMFMAVGQNTAATAGFIFTSRDGINWTRNVINCSALGNVRFGANFFGISGNDGFTFSDSGNLWRGFQYQVAGLALGYGNGVFFTGQGAAANIRTITRSYSYNTATSFLVPSIPPIYDTTYGLKSTAYIRAT
jgi:hypothetical protein